MITEANEKGEMNMFRQLIKKIRGITVTKNISNSKKQAEQTFNKDILKMEQLYAISNNLRAERMVKMMGIKSYQVGTSAAMKLQKTEPLRSIDLTEKIQHAKIVTHQQQSSPTKQKHVFPVISGEKAL